MLGVWIPPAAPAAAVDADLAVAEVVGEDEEEVRLLDIWSGEGAVLLNWGGGGGGGGAGGEGEEGEVGFHDMSVRSRRERCKCISGWNAAIYGGTSC